MTDGPRWLLPRGIVNAFLDLVERTAKPVCHHPAEYARPCKTAKGLGRYCDLCQHVTDLSREGYYAFFGLIPQDCHPGERHGGGVPKE